MAESSVLQGACLKIVSVFNVSVGACVGGGFFNHPSYCMNCRDNVWDYCGKHPLGSSKRCISDGLFRRGVVEVGSRNEAPDIPQRVWCLTEIVRA